MIFFHKYVNNIKKVEDLTHNFIRRTLLFMIEFYLKYIKLSLRHTLLFIFVFTSIFSFAQTYSSSSKKAIKKLKIAIEYYREAKLDKAEELTHEALLIDSNFIEAYLLLSDLYNEKADSESEIKCYQKILQIDSKNHTKSYYYLANAYLKVGRYADASENYSRFLSKEKKDSIRIKRAIAKRKQSEFASYAILHPVPYDPVNMGEKVNSPYHDYWPSLTADGKYLYKTVLYPISKAASPTNDNWQENFFVCKNIDGNWTTAKDIGAPINTPLNEGAQTIAVNGQYMIFTACNRPNSFGSCDLYIAQFDGEHWSIPKNMGSPINTRYWESQPSLSSDGRSLYFVSNRAGGKGKMDIWVSYLQEDGKWQEPINLGTNINTELDEKSPFIHPDDQSLYFSSDSWTGMGGADLFLSRKDSAQNWQIPKNLGYPINSPVDEDGLIINLKGNMAIIASNRENEKNRDLYSFELYPEIRPKPVSYVKGFVYNSITHKAVVAHFKLIELKTEQIKITSNSDKLGHFLICLLENKSYALNVTKKGYLFYSENFTLTANELVDTNYIMEVPLVPIKIGNKTILKNIFFGIDSYILKKESFAELNQLVNFVTQNPSIKIEIGGHTDNTGTLLLNQKLSTNRAKAVYDYLIQHGIDKNRLSYKGYADSEPIASNKTTKGKRSNRRTEFKIIR